MTTEEIASKLNLDKLTVAITIDKLVAARCAEPVHVDVAEGLMAYEAIIPKKRR
jgi:predicted transcriptional regulator